MRYARSSYLKKKFALLLNGVVMLQLTFHGTASSLELCDSIVRDAH